MTEEAVIKEAVIDTNILYYWAGISTMGNGFPFDKIEDYSAKNTKNKIYVSEISMLELFVHYQKEPETISKCIQHMQDQKIPVLYVDGKTILDTKKRYSSFQDAVQRKDSRVQDSFIVEHRKVKVNIEAEYSFFYLVTLLLGLVNTLKGEYQFSDGSKDGDFEKRFVEIMEGSREEIIKDFRKTLDDSYSNGKNVEKVFKHSFNQVLCKYFEKLIGEYYTTYSHSGIVNDPYIQKAKTLLSQGKSLFVLLKTDEHTRNLVTQFIEQFSRVFSEYSKNKNVNITDRQAKYFIRRLERYLQSGKKMAKNDISDMLILSVIEYGKLVLTTDGQFARDLEEIHEPSYNTIIRLGLYKEESKKRGFKLDKLGQKIIQIFLTIISRITTLTRELIVKCRD